MKLLDKNKFALLTDLVKQVPFNHLFARTVTENKIAGRIYVDDPERIKTAYVVHPYGMTLLLGDSTNENFNAEFRKYALNSNRERNSFEWMQTHPVLWDRTLKQLFHTQMIASSDNTSKKENGIVELNTRVNFKFNSSVYLARKPILADPSIKIVPADRPMFRAMRGTVVPKYFWDSEDDFFANGMAYCLLYEGELAAMSFSSYRFDHLLELGIETHPEFRGKGLAEMVCTALIDYCIENHYEPVWACRKENTGSYKLALKLGFEPYAELPYYRLSN